MGIHFVLCSKLRQFPYEDIEFFLPQLCHLIISVDNESMALEEFLLDLCEESVSAALLVCLVLPSVVSLCVRPADDITKNQGVNELDFLALPNVPTRSRLGTASASVPDLSESIQ